jgi:hypothetical protein
MINGNVWIFSPTNAIAFFQEAYQNMRTGVSGNTGKLCAEYEKLGKTMYKSRARTKTSSEDIVCGAMLTVVDEIVLGRVDWGRRLYTLSSTRASNLAEWQSAELIACVV